MNCKICGQKLIVERDVQNIRMGDKTCLPCWYKERHEL